MGRVSGREQSSVHAVPSQVPSRLLTNEMCGDAQRRCAPVPAACGLCLMRCDARMCLRAGLVGRGGRMWGAGGVWSSH